MCVYDTYSIKISIFMYTNSIMDVYIYMYKIVYDCLYIYIHFRHATLLPILFKLVGYWYLIKDVIKGG
jgi:hypothetical protein